MMIEVEKKYKLTKEQFDQIVLSSVFLGVENIYDIYHDFSDYHLIKNGIRFRRREVKGKKQYELKIANEIGGCEEIEDEEEIKKYFKTTLPIDDFFEKELVLLMEYKTERQKYKNGEYKIDIDKLTSDKFPDFLFEVCEIELMVEKEEEVAEAVSKIRNFAEKNGLAKEPIPKKKAIIKGTRPDIYQEIFGE